MIVQYETTHKLMFSVVVVIALYVYSGSSTSLSCNHVCESSKGIKSILSYPFGFSSSCPIQLSCTSSTGDITIRELVVKNISDDRLIVGLPGDCSLSIDDFRNILSNNFALSSKNSLLLMDCNTSSIQTCIVPVTILSGVFSQSCNRGHNISCYSANETQGDSFLDYDIVTKDCGRLFSSILVHYNESTVDLDVQTVELGWRIFGKCNCSILADCISDNFPDPGGYRCRCKQGFIGDGYPGSTGCRKDEEFFDGLTWQSVMVGYSFGIFIGLAYGNLMLVTRTPKWLIEMVEEKAHKMTRTKGKKLVSLTWSRRT